MKYQVTVLGAGLAGCEAALWLAGKGVQVELYEQKPTHFSPAHKSEGFAELICSNSLKAERLDSASGLLKEEMRRMGSQLLNAAEAARVAAGGHTGRLGGIEELAAHPAHLLLEQTGSGIQPLGLEAVGADELGKSLALVGRGKVGGFLLIELHLHALARQPERRLAARKAGTQYSNLIFHSFSFSILALSVIASQCHLFPTLSPTVTFLPAPGRIFPKVGGLGSPRKVYLFAKGSPFERLPPAGGRCRASDKGRASWRVSA